MTASSGPAWGQIGLDREAKPNEKGKAQVYGDFRHRVESDWDSHRADGTLAQDRDRLRIRLRLGFNWNPTPVLSAGVRVRSGSRNSQQSPHVTFKDFDGNATGDQDMLLDKYFFQVRRGGALVWGGRNDLPLWKQNELFWDDDVTPVGVGGRYSLNVGTSSLTFNAGTFSLPDGGIRFNGNLHMGQAVYAGRAGRFGYTAAGGVVRQEGSEEFRNLRNGNGERSYTIWVANLQGRIDAGRRPLTLGFDLMHNAEDYASARDAFTAANRDEKDGFLVSAHWGATGRRNDWQVGYYYVRIETLAVNASFAQDDWTRWGSATQTDSSDFKGHELRFTYVPLNNRTTVVARLYVTDAITSGQESRRFRVDLNTSF
jgi:hypothetical protein